MNKKIYIGLPFAFFILFLGVLYDGTNNIIYYLLFHGISIITPLWIGFELLFKNNIFLISGFEKEDAEDPKNQKKYRKLAIILGLLCFSISIYAIIDSYNYLKSIGFL